MLPLIGAVVIVLWRPDPAVAGGLILVATAPQAMSSNFFCLLGRANVALSVTLTAASSVLAVAATPLAASLAFELLMDQHGGFALPPGEVMRQVLTGLVLPVGIGMLVRHCAPGFVERNRKLTQRLTIAAHRRDPRRDRRRPGRDDPATPADHRGDRRPFHVGRCRAGRWASHGR